MISFVFLEGGGGVRTTMAEAWTQWEGQVVNGVYPLRRFLNASDHSCVFLTESTTEGFLNAAIKLIAAGAGSAEVQLWQWKTATTFSHPHLIRLLDSGQCEIGGQQLLFVVMEYAEENLSQVLPYRSLAPDEARELLVPTLDALASLHGENWVQGQLKPTNFLVVNDQLKLAMDTIRSAGVAREPLTRASLYDPPEAERGEISLATDIWALGVTLVEALTQYPPTWPVGKSAPPALPANLPPEFLDIVQRCLSVDPGERPTVAELQELTKPLSGSTAAAAPAPAPQQAAPAAQSGPRESVKPAAPAPQSEAVMRAMPPHSYSPSSRNSTRTDSPSRSVVGTGLAALVVVVLAVWGGSRLLRGHSNSEPAAPVAQTSEPSEAPQAAASPPSAVPSNTPPPRAESPPATPPQSSRRPVSRSVESGTAVVHEEIPKIPPSARQTIRGHVKVSVRVTVNKSGNVVHESFENASSSQYFNRMAREAARKWTFTSADNERAREWLLHFEFGRDGTTVHASRSRS